MLLAFVILAAAVVSFLSGRLRMDLVAVSIMGPGGYRFDDFLNVGIPLALLVLVVSLLFVPLLWLFWSCSHLSIYLHVVGRVQ